MKLRLEFANSLYDCKVIIQDAYDKRVLYFPLASEGEDTPRSAEIEVAEGECLLTLIPVPVDCKQMFDELEAKTWKDKLVGKLVKKRLELFEKLLLRVSCTYCISSATDGDLLFVNCQWYSRESQLDLIPVAYIYYEVEHYGKPLSPTAACGLNRDEVVKGARKIAWLDFGPELIFTYPIGVGRVKRLTKDKKITRTLQTFYALPEEKRQAIREKMEK